MTKVDIISGFLGAGKTTLIAKLLKEGLAGEQVVLIENEFGEIGIDGGFLKESGVEIREMNSGCICCSLVGDFGTSLKEVVEKYHPDRIIIEPSGVGKLSDVIKAVKDLHIENELQVTKRVPILRKKSFEPHIVDCDYFTVDKVVLDGQRMKKIFGEIDKTSFASLLVLDGAGKVQSGEESVDVQKGDSIFITANAGEYEMKGKFEALLTTV